MAGERTIFWGADSTAARYKTHDTGDGANFVVAEDLDGSTVLLEWDDSATPSTWQVRGPVEMNSNDITGVSSLSTDTLTVDGFTGTPVWTEESGSPYTATANSINPSGLDTYDTYLIYCKATDNSGTGNNLTMQIEGNTSTNYTNLSLDGTRSTGDSEWGRLARLAGNDIASVWLKLYEQKQSDPMYSVLTVDDSGTSKMSGRNNNLAWPISQFTMKRGVDTDFEVRVWGRDV